MTPEEGRQVAQQALELLKITGEGFSLLAWYTATLVQTLAWPAILFGIVWILRIPITGLIEGIAELVFEYKGVKVSLKKALDKVAKEYSRVEEKLGKQSKSPRPQRPAVEQALPPHQLLEAL
jgi:hypothetical protein